MVSVSRVFLTGFSGTGKSTVAALVAQRLGWRALDTDSAIEETAGTSIAEIFSGKGEAAFRELERQAVEHAANEERAVIATGGGAPLDQRNRRAMAGGLVIGLEASTATIAQRLSEQAATDERPLLTGDDPETRIATLRAQRQKYYALADVLIDTEGLSTEEVADRVVTAVRSDSGWYATHPGRLLLPEEYGPLPQPVTISAPSRRYDANIGWGTLDRLGDLVRSAGVSGAAWVVSDDAVLPRHGERALASLRDAGVRADAFAIPAGEASKRLNVAATVYDWLVDQRAERGDAVVALGGGVVGDLAGFVAATYLRGIALVMAPTSVLSMVDASIGGKVAVDHAHGKNLIGAFYQPSLIVDDVSVLKTLPHRMLAEGYAEAIKHALILSPELLSLLEQHVDDLLHVEPTITVDVVRRNVAIKAAVVAEDERDSGLRAILNYGHTVGHAIEAVGEYSTVLHGAADAIGMMAAAEIGRRVGVTPPAVIERQRALLERFGLPTRAPSGFDPDSVLGAMLLDKKVVAGNLHWVLLEDVGRAIVRSDVPMEIVESVVREALQ